MFTAVIHRRLGVTLFSLAVASLVPGALGGCAVSAEEEEATNEGELVNKLPAANAPALMDAEEISFIKTLNDYRATKSLPPYQVAIGLTKAAQKHSKDMADHKTGATHLNFGGHNPNRDFNGRVASEYPFKLWEAEDAGLASAIGEDCARRQDIGRGRAAFQLMKTNITEGWPVQDAPPNFRSKDFTAIGVARVKAVNDVWYWTVNYGAYADPLVPMLSVDGTASILRNGSFEDVSLKLPDGTNQPALGRGVWNKIADWYPPATGNDTGPTDYDTTDYRLLGRWHVYAQHGGSVAVLKDNAFFDNGTTAGAHGLRIVDAKIGSAAATQLVKGAPGVNYEVSVRSRRVAGDGPQTAYLDFVNANYKRIGVNDVNAAALPGWGTDPVSVSATAPAGTVYVRVILYGTAAEGKGSTFDWDDVRLRAW